MQAFLPNDVSPVEHVFDLRQLIHMLDAAGHIKLPADSRVLGAEVNAQGQLVVSIAHGPAFYGPNTAPLKLRHDFKEEIALQAQIAKDAQAAKCKLMDGLQIDPEKCQKGIGLDFRRVAAQMAEEQKYQEELQARLNREMEIADLQTIKPNLEVAEPPPEEIPTAEPIMPGPGDLHEHIRDRVKSLYHQAHTFYAFRFQEDPFKGEAGLIVPFIPGEPVENMLARLDSIVEKDFPDITARFYRCFRGIIQKVYAEGTTATVETAKCYRQDKLVPIPFPENEGAAKAA